MWTIDGEDAGAGTLVSFSAGPEFRVYASFDPSSVPSPGSTRAHVQTLSAVTSNIPPLSRQLIVRFLTITRQLLIKPHPSDVSHQGSSAPTFPVILFQRKYLQIK
jgi:hypothetical protein